MYFDAVDDRSRLSTRIGRQTKFGGGIFRRFDGIQAGLQVKANLKINVAAGYPVYSNRQARIDNSRAFGSISVDWNAADDKWQASVYALNQRSSGITDRRSIGGEVLFRSKAVRGRALIDYDIVFRKLNAALLTLSANMVDGSNLSVAAEYIHYPTLSATNAVLGQPTSSLRVLQGGFDKQTIYRLAIDRAGVSRNHTQLFARAQQTMASNCRCNNFLRSRFPRIRRRGRYYWHRHQGFFWRSSCWHCNCEAERFLNNRCPLCGNRPRILVLHRVPRDGSGKLTVFEPTLRLTYQATRSIELEVAIGARVLDRKNTAPLLPDRWREKSLIAHVGYRFRF